MAGLDPTSIFFDLVIPGCARPNSGLPEFGNIIVQVGSSRLGWRRPGIQHHALFWIPGSLAH
jgi:hypothetical protein